MDRGYVADKGLLPVRFVSIFLPFDVKLIEAWVRTLGYKAFEQHVISGNVTIHDKISPCIEEWVNAERGAEGCVIVLLF